ncbi:hypothetical protein BpHYR1_018052 [Brachionus plicatilis]|uniref:Uncharacterized protein n=1 Tax=Brachionus plicatilis TaxID=10195 RepID=A0A3M7R0B9_BRAPC|nr:hypothetical protein BpHYR1_018052 [Brachionus plicatilis]
MYKLTIDLNGEEIGAYTSFAVARYSKIFFSPFCGRPFHSRSVLWPAFLKTVHRPELNKKFNYKKKKSLVIFGRWYFLFVCGHLAAKLAGQIAAKNRPCNGPVFLGRIQH